MPAPGKRVPIDVDRLHAALRLSSRFENWRELADAVDVSHVTISKILSKTTKRPGESLVRKLAAALHVPFAWLTGEIDRLPFASGRRTFDFAGKGRTLGPTSTVSKPTVREIALDYFCSKCREALIRDVEQEDGDRSAAEHWVETKGAVILPILMQLTDVEAWRTVLLDVPEADRAPVPSNEDFEALTRAVCALLEPWFVGEYKIDVETVLEIVRMQQDAVWPMSLLFIPAQGERRPSERRRTAKKRTRRK
jgi:transcriptional regulator with XRE-family HTH domain